MSGFFGRVLIVADSNDSITTEGTTDVLDPGNLYLWHPTAGASLIDEVATLIEDLSSVATTAAINSTTGKVTISCASSITISNLDLYAELGFSSANLGTGTSFTGSRAAKHVWLPGCAPSGLLSPTTSPGLPTATVSQTRTLASNVYTSRFDNAEGSIQELTTSYVTAAKTFKNQSSPDNSSFEEFWQTVIATGRQFIWLPDYPTSTDDLWEYTAKVNGEVQPDIKSAFGAVHTHWHCKFSAWGMP